MTLDLTLSDRRIYSDIVKSVVSGIGVDAVHKDIALPRTSTGYMPIVRGLHSPSLLYKENFPAGLPAVHKIFLWVA